MSTALPDVGAHPDRLVSLEAVHNFRDLGGYPTADGHSTRWRVLYRADGLYRLTPADLDVMSDLGISTVIDLRTHAELDERGTWPVDAHPVEFHHRPVIDATWRHDDPDAPTHDAVEFLLWAYRQMLDTGRGRFAEVLGIIAASSGPTVFHCAAGKDRTGITAALLLAVLGVPDEYIVADYALTRAGMERMRAWFLATYPESAERMADTPSAFMAAEPEAMQLLLDGLRAEHGSLEAYVRDIGVSDATVAQLAARLLV